MGKFENRWPCNLYASLRRPDRVWSHGHDHDLDTIPVLLDADGLAGGHIQQEDEVWHCRKNLWLVSILHLSS